MNYRIIRCEYNMDNCRVEVEYSNGTIVSIDTLAVEDAFDVTMIQQAALDYLIYNKPMEYVELVFGGGVEDFIKHTSKRGYGLQD